MSLDEIKANDYNLNITRYIDSFESYENIDLKASELKIYNLESERKKLESEAKIIFDKIVI